MPMGPHLEPRQVPWFVLGLGAIPLALGIVGGLGGLGVLPGTFAGPAIATEFLIGVGVAYAAGAAYLFRRNSRYLPGSREYERLHAPPSPHRPVSHATIAYWLGMGTMLAGLVLLAAVEGGQGRCYKGAPNPCLFSLAPSGGLEFVGTALLIGGPSGLAVYGAYRFVMWRRERHEEEAVRPWLDGEGPLP